MGNLNKLDNGWTRRHGQAGVYQVASQLLLRGVNVYFPAVDSGVDLVTDSGIRIQVKMTHLARRARRDQQIYAGGAYWFHFMQRKVVKGGKGLMTVRGRDFASECDLVVLWGVDHNRFWIVPACELAECQCTVLAGVHNGAYKRATRPDSRAQKIMNFENRWDLVTSHDELIHDPDAVEQEVK